VLIAIAAVRKEGYYLPQQSKTLDMNSTSIPQKTDIGWVVDVPSEIAQALGVADGSIAILYAKDGRLEVEILPPPSNELVESVRQTHEQFKEAFDEMKRLGD
jgi:hypothetical protein